MKNNKLIFTYVLLKIIYILQYWISHTFLISNSDVKYFSENVDLYKYNVEPVVNS